MEGEVRGRNISLKMATTTLRKDVVLMYVGIEILEERSRHLSIFEVLQLMLGFGMFVLSLLTFVVAIIVLKDKK